MASGWTAALAIAPRSGRDVISLVQAFRSQIPVDVIGIAILILPGGSCVRCST
jgi:hypothetical protein